MRGQGRALAFALPCCPGREFVTESRWLQEPPVSPGGLKGCFAADNSFLARLTLVDVKIRKCDVGSVSKSITFPLDSAQPAFA